MEYLINTERQPGVVSFTFLATGNDWTQICFPILTSIEKKKKKKKRREIRITAPVGVVAALVDPPLDLIN